MLLETMEELSQTLAWQELDPTMTNRRLCQRTSLPTNGTNCKDSICIDPKLVLDSNVKGPNNKICREWVKRLSLSYWIVVSHGVHGNRTGVNRACPRRLSPRHGLGGSGSWPWSQSPSLDCFLLLFILAFTLPPTSTCRFSFLRLILVSLAHT